MATETDDGAVETADTSTETPAAPSKGKKQKTRTARVGLRLPKRAKQLIEQGAALAGTNLTDFIVMAAEDRARETIAAFQAMDVNEKMTKRFVDAILARHTTSTSLVELFEREDA